MLSARDGCASPTLMSVIYADVSYKIVSTPEAPHVVSLFMHMKTLPELKK